MLAKKAFGLACYRAVRMAWGPSPILVLGVLGAWSAFGTFARADKEPPRRLREAPDGLTGHFRLAPRLAYLLPMGEVQQRVDQRGQVGTGVGVGLELEVGISRYVGLSVDGELGSYQQGSECPSGGTCSATSASMGLAVNYHLVHGLGIDPWLQVGVGYKWLRREVSGTTLDLSSSYAGPQWLQLGAGADWFATRSFGLGPYADFAWGRYTSVPSPSELPTTLRAGGTINHTQFAVGLRGVLDWMR